MNKDYYFEPIFRVKVLNSEEDVWMKVSKKAKKLELMEIKPQSSREAIKRNLIAYLSRQGIHVKPGKK